MHSGVSLIWMLMLLLAVAGCGSQSPTTSRAQSQGGVGGGNSSAQGFDSPDAALDAYGKAMVDGDGVAYRKLAAKDAKAIQGLDVLVQFEKGKSPAEAAKINLQALAPNQGFGNAVGKRFPAEVNGDNAVIVQVFERPIALKTEIHFRKFKFSKSSGKWYLVGSEFGEASTLPEKYAWNKVEEIKVVDSSALTPIPIIPSAESVDHDQKNKRGNNSPGSVDPRPITTSRPQFDLFNGEDLSGWNYFPTKDSKHRSNKSWFADKERKVLFSVGGDRNELSTVDSFRDFNLELQWRWRPGSEVTPNGSGVVVRADNRGEKASDPIGLEIELRPNEEKEIGLGNGTFIAYNVTIQNDRGTADGVKNRILGWRRQPGPIVDGQWNDLRISCIEDRVTVTLNGVDVNEGWKLSAREGKIVLRNQNSGVEFRNIRLTEDNRPRPDEGAKQKPDSPLNPPKAASYRPHPKDHSEFRDLAVESHDCRVFFPDKPEFTEQNVKIAEGNVHVANFQGKTPRASYAFEIYTYPEAFVTKMGAEALLKQTRDNLVDAPTGRLISSKSITYRDLAAQEFVYEHPDTTGSGTGHCRIVMRGNRVYVMEVDGFKVPPAEITVFHDSLAPFALEKE